MLAHLTVDSCNRKTGRMPCAMTESKTCPPACKMKKSCYAGGYPMGVTWRKMHTLAATTEWPEFCEKIRKLDCNIWRNSTAGDLPGRNDRLNARDCLMLAEANCSGGKNRGGYTYTHYPVLDHRHAEHNLGVIREMTRMGFRVNLSADSVTQADRLHALGLPVALVIPGDSRGFRTPAGNTVMLCRHAAHGIQCIECRLCQRERNVIVGLPAHGFREAKLTQELKQKNA
jgi:hypothetical protein